MYLHLLYKIESKCEDEMVFDELYICFIFNIIGLLDKKTVQRLFYFPSW